MGTRPDPEQVYLSYCTCPDLETAQALARTLVAEHLAACVNVLPGLISVYRWQARIETDAEVLLLMKTTQARVADLAARIDSLHPYEVPEVISHPITAGHPHYLDWVRQCTANTHR
ncbi:MAG: divalent-cation tolerance protein CutA [Halochromatium sp.]|uniref:divalent-cation tolerance protein CutA n=1 Tax=Halochromatium sp. TaxID=2049430 RepID=UPI00397D0E30